MSEDKELARGEPIPPRRAFYYPDIFSTKPIAVETSDNATEREIENIEMLLNMRKCLKEVKRGKK